MAAKFNAGEIATPFNPLLRRFDLPGKLGAVGCTMSERAARVVQPPNFPGKSKEPEGRRRGRPFFGSFLWPSKERTRPPGDPGTENTPREAHTTE